jgi:hypothetical protein
MLLGLVNGGLGLQLTGASNALIIAYGVVGGIVFGVYFAGAMMGSLRRMKSDRERQNHGPNKESIALRNSPQSSSPPMSAPPPRRPYNGYSGDAERRERYV